VEWMNLCKDTYQKIHIYILRSGRAVCTVIKENNRFFSSRPHLPYQITMWSSLVAQHISRKYWTPLRVLKHIMGSCSQCFPSVAFRQLMVNVFDLPDWVIHISPGHKSSGVKSLDLEVQAICTPLPIHQPGVCD
jgi:hypothetical protein